MTRRPPQRYYSKRGNSKTTRHNFTYGGSNYSVYNTRLPIIPATVASTQSNVASFVSHLNSETEFSTDTRDEILENLYVNEPTVASAADSFGVMVRDSFHYFSPREIKQPKTLINVLKEKFITSSSSKLEEMIAIANEISYDLNVPDLVETLATLMFVKGTVFLRINKDKSFTILPNPNVTVVDTLERIMGGLNMIGTKSYIMEANYLIIDEGLETQVILNKDEFIILKFRDVPLFVQDGKGRNSYGIYSISPLKRAFIPIWYKRIAMANDALWRAKSVPREHHQLSAESFSSENFTGRTRDAQIAASQAAAAAALAAYKDAYEITAPDQAYYTLDNATISMIEPHSASFMNANALIEQMNQEIYSAINMPQSIVTGTSSSNYASELVISSYTSIKVKQVASKIMRVIINLMKERLLDINLDYPVDQLDAKISYTLANSKLENAKISQVFASMGICYANELREMNDLDPLDDKDDILIDTSNKITVAVPESLEQQKFDQSVKMAEEIKKTGLAPTSSPSLNSGGQSLSSSGKVNYPTTPHSAQKQPSDSGDSTFNKVTQKK